MLHKFFSFRFVLLCTVAVAAAVGLVVTFAPSREAGAVVTPRDLHGWAWSSNIGWISFNCANISGLCETSNYKVVFNDEGAEIGGYLEGYAWNSGRQGTQSGGIGWIRFNPQEPDCPQVFAGPGCGPYVDTSGALGRKAVTGWARACSVFVDQTPTPTGCSGALKPSAERGGWDGWIALSDGIDPNPNDTTRAGGTFPTLYTENDDGSVDPLNFGEEDGGVTYRSGGERFVGYAWGGDVIGWLNFGGVTLVTPPPLPEADIKANGQDSLTVPEGTNVSLTWCGASGTVCTNADSCTVSPSPIPPVAAPGKSGPPGTYSTGPLSASQTYTLTCENTTGPNSDSVTIDVTSLCGNGVIDGGEQCDNGAANGMCPATCSTSCTTNSCVAADFTLTADPATIVVDASHFIYSYSSPSAITVTPSGGYAGDVQLSVIGVTPITPAGFLDVYTPDENISPAEYDGDTTLRTRVESSAADPETDKTFTVTLHGQDSVNPAIADDVDLTLIIRASDPGGGPQ